MQQYKDLIEKILTDGEDRKDRTGVGTRSIFGHQIRFSLEHSFPLVTIRPTAFRIAFEEMMFFLRGQTDTKILEEKNINIWKGNTSRKFLDSVGLDYLPEGNMGMGYSHQIRNFGGHYGVNDGKDQLMMLIDGLINNPQSRRHIISHWNPQQLRNMALPPCHVFHQYYVSNDNKLSCHLYIRSNDVIYGMPYNIAEYAFLTCLLAKVCGYEAKELIYSIGDAHIYNNQIPMAEKMLDRLPFGSPKLVFNKDIDRTNFLSLQYSDVTIEEYKKHPDFTDKPKMAV